VGTGSYLPGVKWLWHEADHSPPSNAMVRNVYSYNATPHTYSWHGVQSSMGYVFMV